MKNILLKRTIHPDIIAAGIIIFLVSLFIIANFWVGFVWPLYLLAMGVGLFFSVVRPKAGMFAVVFLTIVFERFFTLASMPILRSELKLYPLDIFMAGILLGIFFQLLGRKISLKLKGIDYLLILFIFYNLASYCSSIFVIESDSYLAFSTFKNYGFYSLWYLIAIALIQRKEDLKRFFQVFFAGALVLVVFIVLGIVLGEGLWTQYTPLSTVGVRTLAFTHGLYLSLAVVPLTLYLVMKKKIESRRMIHSLIIIWTVGIVGSMMRHLWISLMLAVFGVFILLPGETRRALRKTATGYFFAAIGVVVLFSYLMVTLPASPLVRSMENTSAAIMQRGKSISNANVDESFMWRRLVWNASYQEFQKTPVWGIGTGKRVYVQTDNYQDFVEVRNIHNSYLAVAIQLGTLGIGILLLFVGGVLKKIIRFSGDSEFNFYKFSIVSGILLYLVALAFQPYLETNLLAIFFWMLLGLGVRLSEIMKLNAPVR